MADHSSSAGRSSARLERFLRSPRRALWVMALPMIAGMAVHNLYVIIDTAFIGTLGTQALAAATFVGPLFFLMVALTMGLGSAVTALVAQAVGRRDPEGADQVAGTALGTGLVIGVAFALAGLWAGPWLLGQLGAHEENARLAWEYFQVIAAVVPLFFVSSVLRSILTGEGDARTPMIVLAVSTVVNICLDALFILVFGWGLRGAALATTASVLVSLSTFSWLLVRRRNAFVRLRLDALAPASGALRQLLGLAAPTAASMAVMAVGAMLVNRLLAWFSATAVAAYGAASKVDMIVAMPIFGLAGAAISIVGMFAGAGRADLVRSTALYTYRWALLMAGVIGASAYFGSQAILRIFSDDAQVLAIGHTYLGFMVFVYPLMAVGMTTGRLLQGIGYGLPSLIITTVRVLVIGVSVAYVAVLVLDAPIEGVWTGILAGSVCATVLSLAWVRRLVWLRDPTMRARVTATSQSALTPSEEPSDETPDAGEHLEPEVVA